MTAALGLVAVLLLTLGTGYFVAPAAGGLVSLDDLLGQLLTA